MTAQSSSLPSRLAVPATASRWVAILLSAAIGVSLLYVSGFAAPILLHNAAHDWRHAHNFPCH